MVAIERPKPQRNSIVQAGAGNIIERPLPGRAEAQIERQSVAELQEPRVGIEVLGIHGGSPRPVGTQTLFQVPLAVSELGDKLHGFVPFLSPRTRDRTG